MSVVIETTLGDIIIDLYTQQRPKTCKNFLKLCKTKYYNFNLFHTIQQGFIAQTGDPTGSGKGGESIFGVLYGDQARFYEGEKAPRMKHSKLGTVSMVNCGDGMVGSQFFITLDEHLTYLDADHCVFGEVAEGFEVLSKLNEAICDGTNRPYKDIRISHTVILEDPYDDPPGLILPDRSPSPTPDRMMGGRIAADEDIDDLNGKTMQEIEEIIQEKEAKSRATILEMVGDLPDADVAPPENVLFVCKLNPVTSDEDLEVIFSRFGKVKNCEVIRDSKSGESLQYSFIEFEDRKACEDAYFKMDNVLIDDRRIHVDFSQSVSRYKWKGKGRGVDVFDDKGKPENFKRSAPWVRNEGGSSSKRYFSPRENAPTGSGRMDKERDHGSSRMDRERDHGSSRMDRERDHGSSRMDRERDHGSRMDRERDHSKSHSSYNDKHKWSRSPPRYSRGHATEQKRKSHEQPSDIKLLNLLKKELKTKKKKKHSKSKRSKRSKSSESSDSSSD